METRSDKSWPIAVYIYQCRYLLERLLKQREEAFRSEGGLRERMTHVRLEARRQKRSGGTG